MSSEPTARRKKTTNAVYVQSRYKQAADTFSSQSSHSKERSSQENTKIREHSPQSIEKSLMQSTASWKSNISKYGNSTKKFTSTPAIQGHHALPPINASAITDASGFLCPPKGNRRPLLSSTGAVVKQVAQKNKTKDQALKRVGPISSTQRTKPESNPSNSVIETEINLLYAEYLQAKLLESNAKKAVEKRSKYASEQIHQIWCLMQQLMVKNAAIHKDLNFVSYLITLHRHLCKQERMLLPTLETISQLESQYEAIAKAVDIVRHKLEVQDVSLPNTDSKDEIIQLLQKIGELVKTLKSMHNSDEINSAASVSDTFVKQGKLVAEEIQRGEKLLSEANDLSLTETSLKLASLKT